MERWITLGSSSWCFETKKNLISYYKPLRSVKSRYSTCWTEPEPFDQPVVSCYNSATELGQRSLPAQSGYRLGCKGYRHGR